MTAFPSTTAKFDSYNFHRPEQLVEIESWIHPAVSEGRVALFLDSSDYEYAYVINALEYQSRNERPLRTAVVDLSQLHEVPVDGRTSVSNFTISQLKRCLPSNSKNSNFVARLLRHLEISASSSILSFWSISIALSVNVPLDDSGLDEELERLLRSPYEEIDTLDRLIGVASRVERFVLHILSSSSLPFPLFATLLDSTRKHPNFSLVLSNISSHLESLLSSRYAYRRFHLGPLIRTEVRAIIDRKFPPNQFPDDFYKIMFLATGGAPSLIASKMLALVTEDAISQDHSGSWHIVDGIESESFRSIFYVSLWTPVDTQLWTLEPDNRKLTERVLEAMALCGNTAPVALLLEESGLSQPTERDDVVDIIDRNFGEESPLQTLRCHEYQHPGFPRELTYSFTNPLMPSVIVSRMTKAQRAQRAVKILEFLRTRLPLATRATARLFLNLTSHLDVPSRLKYEWWLTWWAGTDHAACLEETLRRSLMNGSARPDEISVLCHGVCATRRGYPAYLRLALLNAYGDRPGGIPLSEVVSYNLLRAVALHQLGEYEQAISNALRALDSAEGEAYINVQCQVARSYCELSQLDEAETHLLEAYNYAHSHLRDEQSIALTKSHIGMLRLAQGDPKSAESLFKEALEVQRKLGSADPALGQTISGLAWSYRRQKLDHLAVPLHEELVEIALSMYGREHPEFAVALDNLSMSYVSTGNLDGALKIRTWALEVLERAYGPNHHDVAICLSGLGHIFSGMGRHREALEANKRALRLTQGGLGAAHPATAVCLDNLASSHHALGELDEAIRLREDALRILDAAFPDGHPDTVITLLNLASSYTAKGNEVRATHLRERARTLEIQLQS